MILPVCFSPLYHQYIESKCKMRYCGWIEQIKGENPSNWTQLCLYGRSLSHLLVLLLCFLCLL